MRYQRDLNKNRWLAYFDLLGIRQLLAEDKELDVFSAYDKAIKECGHIERWTGGTLQHAWFSDTFLIWAPDDSTTSFHDVDQMARIFADSLLQARIPLRGAVSCGLLYTDVENKVFFGSALVEAYEYGEGQDWIGLLLSPSATKRLDSLGVPINASYYASFEVAWKRRPACRTRRIAQLYHRKVD